MSGIHLKAIYLQSQSNQGAGVVHSPHQRHHVNSESSDGSLSEQENDALIKGDTKELFLAGVNFLVFFFPKNVMSLEFGTDDLISEYFFFSFLGSF